LFFDICLTIRLIQNTSFIKILYFVMIYFITKKVEL
jgi:hypothetical protein